MRLLGSDNRVLLAEDSSVVRRFVRAALGDLDLDIVEATDGVEAMAQFERQTFLAVITDWNMPNKDGLEVIEEIRGAGSHVPIIMITTEASRSKVVQAIQAGADCYLVKPFTAETLKEKLQALLPEIFADTQTAAEQG